MTGFAFFGDPLTWRAIAYLNRKYPNWQKLLELQKQVSAAFLIFITVLTVSQFPPQGNPHKRSTYSHFIADRRGERLTTATTACDFTRQSSLTTVLSPQRRSHTRCHRHGDPPSCVSPTTNYTPRRVQVPVQIAAQENPGLSNSRFLSWDHCNRSRRETSHRPCACSGWLSPRQKQAWRFAPKG